MGFAKTYHVLHWLITNVIDYLGLLVPRGSFLNQCRDCTISRYGLWIIRWRLGNWCRCLRPFTCLTRLVDLERLWLLVRRSGIFRDSRFAGCHVFISIAARFAWLPHC